MQVSCLIIGSNADNPATTFTCTTLSTMQQHLQHCDNKLTALHTAPTLTTTQSFNDENTTIGKLQDLVVLENHMTTQSGQNFTNAGDVDWCI